jgi:hypothetical protein
MNKNSIVLARLKGFRLMVFDFAEASFLTF